MGVELHTILYLALDGASGQQNAPADLPAGRERKLPFNCKPCCMYFFCMHGAECKAVGQLAPRRHEICLFGASCDTFYCFMDATLQAEPCPVCRRRVNPGISYFPSCSSSPATYDLYAFLFASLRRRLKQRSLCFSN